MTGSSSASPNGDISYFANNGNTSGSEDKKIKRRDRKTISCTTCRKRKIRCDRAKPICGACKKNNVPTHLCVYDDTPWVSAVVKEQNLKNEITELREANEKLNQMIKKRKLETDNLKAGFESYIQNQLNGDTNFGHAADVVAEISAPQRDSNTRYEHLKDLSVNIRKLSLFKYNHKKTASKTFGAFSWQAIGFRKDSLLNRIINYYEQHNDPFREQYKESISSKEGFTLDLLNWRKVYHTVNIEKRYTSIVTNSDKPDKNDVFGKKLHKLAKSMPLYKIVERKFFYFFDMKYASCIDKFFIEEEIKEDFRRIIKKTKKGGVDINVYTEGHDYYSELIRLAGILLFIKFGISFSEDEENNLDSDNLLLKYSIACLYIGRAYITPSLVTLMVLIFLETLKYLNPDDLGDELYIVSGRIDLPVFIHCAYSIATSLGLANDFSRIPHDISDSKFSLDSHVTYETLQGIWLNLLNIDWKQCLLTGSPLVLPTFMGYDKTCSNRKLNHIGMMRKMVERYSVFSDRGDQPLDKILSLEANTFLTRRDLENDLLELSTYFCDNVKSENKFWENFKIRTMETSPEKDQRVLQTLEVLDLTTSLNFFLFESYSDISNPVNVASDEIELSSQDYIDLKNLANRHMNNALLHAAYILQINDWCLSQVINNEAVSKNRLLQVISYPIFKRTLSKAVMVCSTIILRNSTFDEFGCVYKFDDTDLTYNKPENSNIFNYSLHEIDELCFGTNVNNTRKEQYFSENFSGDFIHAWSKIYRYIKQIELIKKDIKWFVSFRELFFGLYYLIQNKRKHCANGKKGDPTKNLDLSQVFILEEHLRFKHMYENNIDPDRDYNRYTLNYILN